MQQFKDNAGERGPKGTNKDVARCLRVKTSIWTFSPVAGVMEPNVASLLQNQVERFHIG